MKLLCLLLLPAAVYAQTGASSINVKGNYAHSASVSVQSKLNNINYATDYPGVVPDGASANMTVTAGSTTITMTGNNSLLTQFSAADVGKTFGFPGVGPSTAPVRLYQDVATAAFTDTYTIAGSVTSGTFVFGETVTQTSTGVRVVMIGTTTGSNPLRITRPAAAVDATHTWVGATSGAVFTPTALPTLSSSFSPVSGPVNYLGMQPGEMPSIGLITADSSKTAVAGTVMTYSAWAYSSQSGSGPGVFDWEVDGSDDINFGTYTVVYTGTSIPSVDFGNLASLDQRDTFRIRFGVDAGPYFRYYRPQIKDHTAGLTVHPVVYLTGNTFSHVLGGKFTAYISPTQMTMDSAATFSSLLTYIPYGTDSAPGIQAAENDMCGGDATQDGCYLAGTLHFPVQKISGSQVTHNTYFLAESLAGDYSHWIGDGPVQFNFSPATNVTTIHGVLCGASTHAPTTGNYPGAPYVNTGCLTPASVGGTWEDNTPVLIRFGNLAGGDSQGALLENIAVNGGNLPANIFYCQTCEEGSGTLNSSFSGNDGSQGARHVLIVSNAAQNSTYRGMQNVVNNNINPPPRMYLTSAITSTGPQTFTINRTDWLPQTLMYMEWRLTSDPTSLFNMTVIDSNCTNGACRVSGNITALHAVGDSLMTYWQPVSVEFISTGTQNLLMDNNTLTAGEMPGWGYGIRNLYSNIVSSKLHLESAFAGIQNHGNMVVLGVDGLYNVSLLIDNHGEMTVNSMNAGSPPGALIYFDGMSGKSGGGFSLDKFSSVNVGEVISGNGPSNFYGGETILSPQGAFIKDLVFGDAVGYRMSFGNRTSSEILGWTSNGNSNGMTFLDQSHDGGQTYPTNIFTIDSNGWFHPQILTFGDQRTATGSCSTYYGHNATLCIPIMRLGANISGGLFAMEHTGSFGNTFNFLASNNSGTSWNVAFSVDSSGNFTAPSLLSAPSAGSYNEPLFYGGTGTTPTWGAYSIPGLLNYLSNNTSLNVGNAVGWDGSKLNNLTGLNLMTTLAGGATFPATSPLKWTGSAINPMTTANLGTFMGLGSSSTPLMMVYQGNTGAFTVQSIPTAATPPSSTNLLFYNGSYGSYDRTSLGTNFFGLTVPSGYQLLEWNGSNWSLSPVPPATPICSGGGPEGSTDGVTLHCVTSAQISLLLTGSAILNGHVPSYNSSTQQYGDGGQAMLYTTNLPTSHSAACARAGTVAYDSTYKYECVSSAPLWSRCNFSGAVTCSTTW